MLKLNEEALSALMYICNSNEEQAAAVVDPSYHSNAFPQTFSNSFIITVPLVNKNAKLLIAFMVFCIRDFSCLQ